MKPGNYGMIKGFILSVCIHGVLFFVGGRLFVKPVQYSVQSADGGIEVDLVAPLPQQDIDTVRSIAFTAEKQQETVKMSQPDVDAVKPIMPTADKQEEAVKIVPQEEPMALPQSDVDAAKSVTSATETQQKMVKPSQPEVNTAKSIMSTTQKQQETVKTTPHSSQGTIRTKSKPGYFQNRPPEYPQLARQMRQEGLVILSAEVDQKGMPVKVEVKQSSGYELLDRAALKAVRQWKFQPERIGDIPVKSTVIIPIRFRLEESERENLTDRLFSLR
jgi:protein TonB